MRLLTLRPRRKGLVPADRHSCRPRLVGLEDRSVPTVFFVTNASDHDPGSLRWAVQQANATAGPDSIQFDVPANNHGLVTIVLSSALPSVSDAVTVDATTEPFYGGSPLVELDGSQVEGPGAGQACGLTLAADGCGVFGLVIDHFARDGISVQSSGNSISANFIDNNGRDGVAIFDAASGNVVGPTAGNGGNDISGNHHDGVEMYDPGTTNNAVDANTIRDNRADGVAIFGGASFNTVGGPPVPSGNLPRSNLISGNGADGVEISGPTTTGNVLKGNWIGLDADGRTAHPNGASRPSTTDNVAVVDSPGNWIGSTDRGMRNVISGCANNGIEISGLFATGNVVEGNWIGTDATGTAAVGNHIGLVIKGGASNTVVGGDVAGARNVISGNSRAGVLISSSPKIAYQTTGNRVLGNWVGPGVNGEKLGAQFAGVWLAAPANQVGGPDAGDANVISGNATAGVYIAGSFARGNWVQGNLIGTDPTGTRAVGNGFAATVIPGAGILLLAPGAVDNRIGGAEAGEGNVISGNVNDGILVSKLAAPAPSGNVIQGNFIGTSRDGTQQVANTQDGIELAAGATGNLVGGAEPGARNLISGNGQAGVSVRDRATTQNQVEGNWIGLDANGNGLGNGGMGVAIQSAVANTIGGTFVGAGNVISGNAKGGLGLLLATGDEVQGNRIGTDPTGTLPRANGGTGVAVLASRGSVIGGTVPGAGNLISANSGDGLLISAKSLLNHVFGNDIGTDGTGHPAAGMGNGANGIEITDTSGLNLIGYPGVGAQNVIAGNAGIGIVMPAGIRSPVRENSIYDNQGGGIHLVPTGQVVATPVLGSVALNADSHPVVQGTLHGAKNTTYYLEFFASGQADATGNGSGELFLNSRPLRVVTDSQGDASFSVVIPALVGPFSYFLSATATDALLNTSGFSNYVQLSPAGGP